MNGFIRLVDHTRYVLLGALLLLTPVLIDFHIIVGAGPESKFRLLEYGVLLCALLSAPVLLARRSSLRLHGQTIAIGALIFYFLLRAWLDPVREFALDVAFRPVSILLFALLVSDACRTSSALRRLIWVGVFSQLFTIAYAVGETFGVDLLFDYIMGVSWRWWNEFVSEDRGVIWNTLGNPNYYASYGAMLLINLLTLFALSRRKRHRCVLAIYLLALIYTLMYTFTRGIWVSLALTAERAALSSAEIETVEESAYVDTASRVAIVSSRGVEVYGEQTFCYVYLSAHARRGDDVQTALGFFTGRAPGEIDAEAASTVKAVEFPRLLGMCFDL